jgi:glycosyltransferase involved in cell wall biosynthesis
MAEASGPAPRISIITPTYNRLALLKESVASSLREHSPSREVIVVDDACDDGTTEWLATQHDPRLHVITLTERSERCAARNAALGIARGEFHYYLDHDDRAVPGGLSHLVDLLDRDPQAVAAAGAMMFFDRSEAGLRCGVRFRRRGDLLLEALSFNLIFPTGTVLYRAAAARRAGPWEDRFIGAEDGEYSFRVLALGPAIVSPNLVVEHRTGSTLYHPGPEEIDGLLSDAQRNVLERLHGRRRQRAETVVQDWARLMDVYRNASTRAFGESMHTIVDVTKDDPRFWLGPGRRLVWWNLRRVFGLLPGMRWLVRAQIAAAQLNRRFVPWDPALRLDTAGFQRRRRDWRREWTRQVLTRKWTSVRAHAAGLDPDDGPAEAGDGRP